MKYLMFYNITRAVTIAFNTLRNCVVWSNLQKLYYYFVSTIKKKISKHFILRVGNKV